MEFSDTLLTIVVSALVSSGTAILAYRSTVSALRQEWRIREREMSRKFTEKLYDLRLQTYPKAFEITDQLRSEFVFSSELTEELLLQVRNELTNWHKAKSGFLMSEHCLEAYYEIRTALAASPERQGSYSKNQRRRLWKAKNRFRGCLKADLDLLYKEEQEPPEFRSP